MVKLKGQMMLITAVIISLIMLSTGSAVSELGNKEYHYRDEAYLTEMLIDESEKVDTRFRTDRENYQKMVGFLDSYTTETEYWERQSCFNLTLQSTQSEVNLNCIP